MTLEASSKVIRTHRSEKNGLPKVHRTRRRPDGTNYTTTERVDPTDYWVRNSNNEITRFDPESFKEGIRSCYGKLYVNEDDFEALYSMVVSSIIASYQEVGRKKVVNTNVIEQSVVSSINELPIPDAVATRYMTRYCIDSLPNETLKNMASAIKEK